MKGGYQFNVHMCSLSEQNHYKHFSEPITDNILKNSFLVSIVWPNIKTIRKLLVTALLFFHGRDKLKREVKDCKAAIRSLLILKKID